MGPMGRPGRRGPHEESSGVSGHILVGDGNPQS